MIEEITVEIQNAPTIEVTAAILTGPAGLDGADGVDGTNGEAFQSATAPDPAEHPLWYDLTDGSLNQWHGTPPAGVWVNVSHEELPAGGVVQIGWLGDSITETASEWAYELFQGTSFNAVYHRARYELANLTTINVAHVNAGANQSLAVSVVGNAVTVTLATDGSGVVTSTVAQVVAFLNASNTYKATGLFARTLGTSQLAQVGAAKYLEPATATTADGYAAWVQLLSGGRFEFIRFNPTTIAAFLAGQWTFGRSGLTTASLIQFLLPDVLLLCAGKKVVEMSGANDILQGVAEATTVTNRCAMWDDMQAAGITVIACEVTPMIESAPLVPTGASAAIVSLNAALKIEATARGIQWIEWPATLFDGTEAEATLWEVDGIHPNPAGCHIMGGHVVTETTADLATADFEFPLAESSKWITANPYLAGAGAIATDWSTPTAYPNAGVTPTAQTIGGRRWQRLTCTQSGAECKLAVFNLNSQPVTAGDRVRILADLKVSSGFKNVRVKATFFNASDVKIGELAAMEAIDDGENMTSSDYTVTLPAHEGTWLSPAELVPNGAVTMRLSVWTFGAGTVDIGICGVIDTSVTEDLIWPTAPADGDLITQGGIQWIYNATKTRWARYRVASTGGVSSFSDLTDVPAALTTPQAAATPSIRAIGTGATDAAAGNHTHPPQTEITIEQFGAVSFTGGISGILNVFADNVDGSYDVQWPNKGGTIAFTSDLGGLSNSITFGAGDEVVSMSAVLGVATFTFGVNAKAAFRTAFGATTTGVSAITAANAAALATAAGLGTTASVTFTQLTAVIAVTGNGVYLGDRIIRVGSDYGLWIKGTSTELQISDSGGGSRDFRAKIITATGAVRLPAYTVATLPATAALGMVSGGQAYVTDANATLAAGIGTTVAAGGANFVPVHYNGTNWIIG